jgi:2-haloacid dehalogenase
MLDTEIDALVFDVIGTLVDDDEAWARVSKEVAEHARLHAPQDLNGRWASILDDRMQAVIAGTEPWQPHRELVQLSAREAILSLGGRLTPEPELAAAKLDREYAAWPDVADATAALRAGRLVVGLSNGDLDSLARLANRNAISWDLALSTATVGTFKPDPAAYRFAIRALDLEPARTLFVAAHPWDLRAAAAHGFRTAYVARPGAKPPAATDHFDLNVPDLHALNAALS